MDLIADSPTSKTTVPSVTSMRRPLKKTIIRFSPVIRIVAMADTNGQGIGYIIGLRCLGKAQKHSDHVSHLRLGSSPIPSYRRLDLSGVYSAMGSPA